MDNPWANAWTAESLPDNSTPQEADIAIPSWSTAAAAAFTASLWDANNSRSSAPGWEPESSPYSDIPIGKVNDTSDNVQPSPTRSLSPIPVLDSPPDHTPSPRLSPPPSPDAFGTFETGIRDTDRELDPWTPARAGFPAAPEADAWGSTWNKEQSTDDDDNREEDEWEAAKRQKDRQDRHVPPQLLSSILQQLEELSADIWPSNTDTDATRDSEKLERLEDDATIAPIASRLIPTDVSLPPVSSFAKTFTAKSLSESLKLTRNLPLTRGSPFAHYLASKGSTAWETSVKARPELAQDDFVPAGWKIVEKEKVEPQGADMKKKGSGGLLSFFGRRTSNPSLDLRERSKSPSQTSTSITTGTPRASADAPKPSPTISSSSKGLPSPTVVSFSSPPMSAEATLPSMTSNSNLSTQSPDLFREPSPPPSAVSRFLTRFSRPRSNPRNSLALSSDDLEFLSDIVPSAADGDDDSNAQLKALSNMLSSAPLPSKLPPPLAPPPSVPQPIRTAPQVQPTSLAMNGLPSLTATIQPTPPPPVPRVPSASTPLYSVPPVIPPPTQSRASGESEKISDPWDFSSFSAASAVSVEPAPSKRTPPISSISRPGSTAPPPPRRIPVAIMSNSSARSTVTPVVPKLQASFNIPPPRSTSSSRSQTPVSTASTSGSQRLPPPPLAPPPKPKPPPANISLFGGDDSFSDFHSPPTSFNGTASTSSSSTLNDRSFTSFSSDQGLFSTAFHSGTSDGFDDFDDFVSSSAIRTPSPPRPPAKPSIPPPLPIPIPTPVRAATPPQQVFETQRKASRAAEHQRTRSLVAVAAAHQGRWPTPASPIPPALAPPTKRQSDVANMFDFMGSGGGSELQTSVSSPALLKPPPGRGVKLPPALEPKAPALASSSSQGAGGLSAQDLSFFEGL